MDHHDPAPVLTTLRLYTSGLPLEKMALCARQANQLCSESTASSFVSILVNAVPGPLFLFNKSSPWLVLSHIVNWRIPTTAGRCLVLAMQGPFVVEMGLFLHEGRESAFPRLIVSFASSHPSLHGGFLFSTAMLDWWGGERF